MAAATFERIRKMVPKELLDLIEAAPINKTAAHESAKLTDYASALLHSMDNPDPAVPKLVPKAKEGVSDQSPEKQIAEFLYQLCWVVKDYSVDHEIRIQASSTLKTAMKIIYDEHVFPPTSEFLKFKLVVEMIEVSSQK
jgi:hypothetical protein